MAVLFQSDIDRGDWWSDELRARIPNVDVRIWPDVGEPADIEFAIVWEPPAGLLSSLPNLRAILSLGAGVDHVFAAPDLPRHVPVCRVVDDMLTHHMTEYVLAHVLAYHRNLATYRSQQARREWRQVHQDAPRELAVGILGLGVLGGAAAAQLAALRFDVAGWSRRPKQIDGVRCYHGQDGLAALLTRSQVLACLLPSTPDTRDVLDKTTLAMLPRGARLINAARGDLIVEDDLLAALDSGQIGHATLDVFRAEPLPDSHPFWNHPNVTITPHIASISDPRSVADQVSENIRRGLRGEPLLNVVDPAVGY